MKTPIIQRALATAAASDAGQFPVQQVTYQGKVADAEVLFPYGMHAKMAVGETYCTLFAINDEEENRQVMGYTPNLRPKNLEPGEVVFYHPLTQSNIHFKNNGDIDIITSDAAEGAGGNLTINVVGNTTVTSTGALNLTGSTVSITATSGNVSVDAAAIELNADTTIDGDSTADDHISNGISGNSHVHGGVQSGGSNTAGPQ